MPQRVLSGSLKGPTGEPAANAEITFTSRRTTDVVLQQTVFTARADAEGSYQIALEYGVFDITVKLDTATVALANRVQISEQTTATTLNQLIVDYQGEQALTPQIVVEFRELTAEARGYRDEAQASAQSASEDATATEADRQAVADNRTHVDQQRQAVDDTADAVEADRLAAQQARGGAEDAQGASETARDESRAWATGDGVIDNISGTDRFSARVEADRAASERQSAESAATASSDSAALAGQRATTAGEHEAAAGDSATEAEHWATYPIDTPVPEGDGSQYSSRHWAEISRQRAVNAMVAQGAWDASTGTLPAEPVGASYWLVTGAPNGVTVEGVEYRNKDMLLWTPGATSSDPGQWSKIDNTDSVVSVAGKSGAVELVPSDVGADPAGTAAQTMNDHVAAADPHTQYVQKVTGKALSTNDYTDAEKSKLAGIQSGATQNATNAQLRDRSTHTGTQPLSTISDAGTAAAKNAGTADNQLPTTGQVRSTFEIYVPDPERRAVEAATGGVCTIERTPTGQPCYMRILSKARCEDLEPGGALGTGVHEAFIVNGVEKSHIMVGMFLAAQVNGEVVSQPGRIPWVNNTFDETRAACAALGTGWHQTTAWEWAYLGLWCMANGYQPTGNTNWGRSHSNTFETAARGDNGAPGATDGDGKTLTGYGPNAWNHDNSASGIADLVGNVWERQNLMKMVDGRVMLAADNTFDMAESAWADTGWDMPSSNQTWANQPNSGAPESLRRALIVPNGVLDPAGYQWTNLSGERVPLRGGLWGNGGLAGLGALFLGDGRGRSDWFLGLRLARVI